MRIEVVLEIFRAGSAVKVASHAKSVRGLQVFNRITSETFVLARVFLLTRERPKKFTVDWSLIEGCRLFTSYF